MGAIAAITASLMITLSLVGALPSSALGTSPFLHAWEGPPPFSTLVGGTPTGTDGEGFNPGVVPSLLGGQFTENAGQVRNPAVRFYASTGGLLAGFAESAVLLKLTEEPSVTAGSSELQRSEGVVALAQGPPARGVLVRLTFESSHSVLPEGRGELPYRSQFFLGNDRAQWRTGVRSFAEIVYGNLYEGIDLVYRIGPEGLKYDFVVQPGTDPGDIRIAYEGIESLEVGPERLVLRTAAGEVRDTAPIAWQDGANVACYYALIGPRSVGFACSGMNPSLALVIDPLIFSSYIGAGHGGAQSVQADRDGFAYVTGGTLTATFPTTPGAYDESYNGGWDAFVVKVHPSGRSLVYATFVGGAGADVGIFLALDMSGNAIVTGQTSSPDFPVTAGGFSFQGEMDAFLFKLGPAGDRLVYSTCLGGTKFDDGRAVAVDGLGNALVTGYAFSPEFPVTPGAYDTSFNGGAAYSDAFVTKVSPTGAIEYSTFFGGAFRDTGWAIAVDAMGNAYVAGLSGDIPTTDGAYDQSPNGGADAFLAKLDPTGSSLLFATYLGGSAYDEPFGVAVDASGSAYVVGSTMSPDFPTTPGAYDAVLVDSDAFVTRFEPDGSGLLFSTLLGGSMVDIGQSVAVLATGEIFVAGSTNSTDFPVTPDAFDQTYSGSTRDVFIALLGPAGDRLAYGTYLGGSRWDTGGHIAVFGGSFYVTGTTNSGDFPTTPGVFGPFLLGDQDGFLARFGFADEPPQAVTSVTKTSAVMGEILSFDGTASTDDVGIVSYAWDFGDGATASGAIAAHAYGSRGTFLANLTVTDTAGQTDSDIVTVSVLNRAPVAVAGPDQSGWKRTAVVLDGSASYDEDSDTFSFAWVQVSGPEIVSIVPDDASLAQFVPTRVGTYMFNLTVWDNYSAASSDWTTVAVYGRAPTAVLTANASSAYTGVPIEFNCSLSTDPDDDPLTYAFEFGDGSTLAGASALADHAYAVAGTYVANLTVTDSDGDTSAVDSVTVVITAPPMNRPPTADAGPDQTVDPGARVTLDGTASSDPDGDPLTYAWTVPAGITLSSTASVMPTFTAIMAGTYAFTLTVTDDEGLTDTDIVTITVRTTGGGGQPAADNTLLVVALIAIIVLLVLVALFAMRRKKKPEEEPPLTANGAATLHAGILDVKELQAIVSSLAF